jgi:hypothetical protein
MQPFRSLCSLREWPLNAPETMGANPEQSRQPSPSVGQIAREVAVIVTVCLGLGLTAEIIVRAFGVG